jgi:hypothetical protein
MKTAAEIKAFVKAYQNIMAYVNANDVRTIALMLSTGYDEEEIRAEFPEATTVSDAYLLWHAAKEFTTPLPTFGIAAKKEK